MMQFIKVTTHVKNTAVWITTTSHVYVRTVGRVVRRTWRKWKDRFWLCTSHDGSSLIWDDCNIIIIIIVIAIIIIIIPVYSRADSATLGRITGTSQT